MVVRLIEQDGQAIIRGGDCEHFGALFLQLDRAFSPTSFVFNVVVKKKKKRRTQSSDNLWLEANSLS